MTLLAVDWVGRPHLANAERRLKHWDLSRIHKEWRKAGAQAWALERPAPMEEAWVTAWAQYPSAPYPDADGIAPSVKCVLDGLVDMKMLPGDDRRYVKGVLFLAPVKGPKGSRPTLYIHLHPTACVVPDAYPQEQP